MAGPRGGVAQLVRAHGS